jgi:hypothetical protein
MLLGRGSQEGGFDSQLVNRLNHDADIMAKHLAECFVDLRGQALTSQAGWDSGWNLEVDLIDALGKYH